MQESEKPKSCLFHKLVFVGYRKNDALSLIIFKTMLLFLVLNVFLVGLYWYSHITEVNFSFFFFDVEVPNEKYVLYFNQNYANSLFLTVPIAFLVYMVQIFSHRGDDIFLSAIKISENSWVRKIYLNQINSFLLPSKNGTVNLSLALVLSIPFLLIIEYTFISTVYQKLSEENLYKTLSSVGEQSNESFILWMLITIAFYQIFNQLLIGAYQTLYILWFKKEILKKIMI